MSFVNNDVFLMKTLSFIIIAYLLSYLDRGGNSRFIRLSKRYNLDEMPIEQKFNTRILEYYRLLVSNENKYNIFLYI